MAVAVNTATERHPIILTIMKAFVFLALAFAGLPLSAQQATAPNANEILEHTKSATVIVLAGEGAGRLHSIATGVIISKDGVILTALHAIKGAAEVQVRMPNGEVFDRVELLGSDERRDVAALKISAGGLPNLVPRSDAALVSGDPVYAVSNANGLAWSATRESSQPFAWLTKSQERDRGFGSCNLVHPLRPVLAVALWLIKQANW